MGGQAGCGMWVRPQGCSTRGGDMLGTSAWPRWFSPWGRSAEKGMREGSVCGGTSAGWGEGTWLRVRKCRAGVGVRGWESLTPREVLMGDSLKRTLRHSSGQTSRSSSGLICSSSWPGSTPRVRTVLRRGDRDEPGSPPPSHGPRRVLAGRGLEGPPTSARSPCPSARLSPLPVRSRGAGWGDGPAAGTKGEDIGAAAGHPVLVGGARGREGRGDTHLSGTVPRLRERLQDVAGDVSPVPPLVPHQPPLPLSVQDLGEVTRGAAWRARGPDFVLPTSTHGGIPPFLPAACPPS